jgi:hypothetical protein
MKIFYLVMAILGAVVPFVFYVQHFALLGTDPVAFLSAAVATPAVRGLTADLVLSSLAFWAVMVHERRKRNGPHPILFVAINLMIGLSCAIPAYLYARIRRSGGDSVAG